MSPRPFLVWLAILAAALGGGELYCRRRHPDWRRALPQDPAWMSFHGTKRLFPDAPSDPGATLIACVGGSTTEGYPFPHAGYPEWLGREARRCGQARVAVVNLGLGGYGTRREPFALREALERRPSIVILQSGHNEVQEEMLYRSIPWLVRGPVGRLAAATALGTTLVRELPRLRYSGPFKGDWGLPAALPEPDRAGVARDFEPRLDAMVRAIRGAGALPVVCVTPTNLHFHPANDGNEALMEAADTFPEARLWLKLYHSARNALGRGRAADARALLERLPPRARTRNVVWLLGQCAEALGRPKEAAADLRQARDTFVASDAIRDAQRRVAARDGAVLVDLEKAFSAGAPDGLPAERYFSDSHHLSQVGYRVAAREILRALAAAGRVDASCPASWDGRADGMLQRELGLDPRYDAAPAALMANELGLYAGGTDDPWFEDRAVDLIVRALNADPRAETKLRVDLKTVDDALARARRRLAKTRR